VTDGAAHLIDRSPERELRLTVLIPTEEIGWCQIDQHEHQSGEKCKPKRHADNRRNLNSE